MNDFVIIFSLFAQLFIIGFLIRDKLINNIFKLSLIGYLFLWVFIPGLIGLFLDHTLKAQSLSYEVIITGDFCLIYVSEVVVIALSLTILKIFSKKSTNSLSHRINNKSVYLSIVFLILLLVYEHLTVPKLSYVENNTLGDSSTSFLLPLLQTLKTFLFCYIILISSVSNNKLVFVTSFITVCIVVVSYMNSGARMSLVALLFIGIYRILFVVRSRAKAMINTILLSSLVFFVLLPIVISVEKARSSDFDLKDVANSSESIDLLSGSASIFQKFNSFSAGVKLIDGYGAGVATYKPYLGSIFILVPQYFFPGKPISGSIDNTYFGTPARLVVQYDNPYDMAGNVGVSPVGISVWQFGWIFGPLFLIVATSINFYVLNKLLDSNKVFFSLLGAYFVPLPGFVGVISSPDVYLKNAVYFIFFYCFIVFFTALYKHLFRKNIHSNNLKSV
jgi:hypothetical protein